MPTERIVMGKEGTKYRALPSFSSVAPGFTIGDRHEFEDVGNARARVALMFRNSTLEDLIGPVVIDGGQTKRYRPSVELGQFEKSQLYLNFTSRVGVPDILMRFYYCGNETLQADDSGLDAKWQEEFYAKYIGRDPTYMPFGPGDVDDALIASALMVPAIPNLKYLILGKDLVAGGAAVDAGIEGSDAPAAQVWQVEDSPLTFVDETADFNSAGANDVLPFPATEAVSDYFAIGYASLFSRLRINIGTSGVGGVVAWEYWNGSAWAALTVTDGTTSFTAATGLKDVTFSPPADWRTTSLNGSAQLFYVRARVTTVYTTNPQITQGFVGVKISPLHPISLGTNGGGGIWSPFERGYGETGYGMGVRIFKSAAQRVVGQIWYRTNPVRVTDVMECIAEFTRVRSVAVEFVNSAAPGGSLSVSGRFMGMT